MQISRKLRKSTAGALHFKSFSVLLIVALLVVVLFLAFYDVPPLSVAGQDRTVGFGGSISTGGQITGGGAITYGAEGDPDPTPSDGPTPTSTSPTPSTPPIYVTPEYGFTGPIIAFLSCFIAFTVFIRHTRRKQTSPN